MRNFNKLFVVALPRCATVSIWQALGQFGIRLAHLGKVFGEPGESHHNTRRLVRLWQQMEVGDERWEILSGCDGLADYPVCSLPVIRLLDQRYPGSLFINVQRQQSVERWLQSIETQFVGLDLLAQHRPDSRDPQFVEVMHRFRQQTFGSAGFDAARYRRAYEDYQRGLSEYFGQRDDWLQIVDVDQLSSQGFQLLGQFLQVDELPRGSFPRCNQHSAAPRAAFMEALSAGRIDSQTGIEPPSSID